MITMKLPQTGHKRALIVVDLQPAFIRPHNEYIIPNIKALITRVPYDAYIEAVFSAEKGSLWDKQQHWYCSGGEDTHTIYEVKDLLADKQPLQVQKSTRSVFRGDKDVLAYLRDKGVEEIHIIGTETNDCVLATAFDAFDSGFPVYVLEECCEAAAEDRHDMGVQLLRFQGMTNNRCLADTIEISLEK